MIMRFLELAPEYGSSKIFQYDDGIDEDGARELFASYNANLDEKYEKKNKIIWEERPSE